VVGSSGVGCGKGIVLYTTSHTQCGPSVGGSGTTICYNLTTKPATFLVGLWCKCGGVTTTCPELGHIRATLLPHSDHTVWWKCGEAESIGVRCP
jgi:hypothetical protein